ncbi:MAG: methylmalonyl Co-A mutase-associated GTPase MeaB [Nocardioides sp.]
MDLETGVRSGDRAILARAITLIESTRADHRKQADELVRRLGAAGADRAAGPGIRVGISGVPGVGKSTFIDALGSRLTEAGHRVGVLAVDPSSTRTGGSVLGDKTRMARLVGDPAAYIRPTPTSGSLGGVARATSRTIVLLEAAGYDVVLVETVGVGQSEVTVAEMVDTFCFLTQSRGGDELQGIKKGIVELADVVAVNKADGGREAEAETAARELGGALRLVRGAEDAPRVVTCSALSGAGLGEVWDLVLAHRAGLGDEGLAGRRAEQQVGFAWRLVLDELDHRLVSSSRVADARRAAEAEVLAGRLTAAEAADRILAEYDEGR